jgi:glucokinase
VVLSSPNLPLKTVPLAEMLETSLRIPVVLENDANAAILGETTAGAGVGLRHVVMLTLGTGVGGALYLNGRLYRGAGGGAGELGHVVVQADGLPCRCGNRGCLEMYASGSAMERFAEVRAGEPATDPLGSLSELRQHDRLTGREVSRLAREGDPGALGVVEELAGWVGIALVGLTHTFDPEMIVVGGGVGELGELILGPARDFVRKNALSPGRERVQIAPAKLGNMAGLVGGGLAAWEILG